MELDRKHLKTVGKNCNTPDVMTGSYKLKDP